MAIGEVTRVHGLAGEVRVTPLTDDPGRFLGLASCVVWDAIRDTRDVRRIRAARRAGDAVLVALDGCEDANAAGTLVGRLLAVPESEALPPPEGHFYPWQLEGCRVTTEDGTLVGTIAGIDPSPAQDLWIVRDGARERLIPAVPEIVLEVDLRQRRVVIRPPEGLLEL